VAGEAGRPCFQLPLHGLGAYWLGTLEVQSHWMASLIEACVGVSVNVPLEPGTLVVTVMTPVPSAIVTLEQYSVDIGPGHPGNWRLPLSIGIP